MSCSTAFIWHKRFKEEHEDVEDDPRGGRPSTSRNETNVEFVKKMMHGDRQFTICLISDELHINQNSIWQIITDLEMRKVYAKMVPKLLNDHQKMWCMLVCQDILENLDTNPDFLKKVITGDKTWVFVYDPETKRQSLNWKSPQSPQIKKVRQSKSKIKFMLIAFFDVRGMIHYEFLLQGQTVNQHVYKEILQHLLCSVKNKGQICGKATHGCLITIMRLHN